MCAGKFLNTDGLRRFLHTSKKQAGSYKLDSQQVLLAGQDGYIYIMINFEVWMCCIHFFFAVCV